jgi:cell division transport system permease protein
MLTSFKRVLKFAVIDFYRNNLRAIAAVFVLVITIFLAIGLFFLHGMSSFIIQQVQNKIDITAYFKADTAESDILSAKDKIAKEDPDIKNIEYVSKDQALALFTQKHQDNPVFTNALNEVGENPFLPSLNITTNGDASQYQQIATILQEPQYSPLIDRVDFSQKKDTIDKVFSITSGVSSFGLVLAIIFMIIAVLVVFNTVKLAVDSAKEEISTMRIVGASSWFVRAPFVIQGAIFGCISFIICFVITALAAYFLTSSVAVVMSGFSLWNYFLSNIWMIMLIQLASGIGLGVVSSFIVVQRYLKV